MNSKMYKKRAGTSGIQGQLYETKLISLIYFRMIHDPSVEQFSLATNKDDVGAFDDICFKAKVKELDKSVTVFIQAKHRENNKHLTFTSETELTKYFNSYLDIRSAFDPKSKDMIFGGKFHDSESFFVMYTTAKDDPNNKTYEGSYADCLNELLGTGGSCTQPSYKDEDLDYLCKIVMIKEITTLAEQVAKFICEKSGSEISLNNNDILLRYHVILSLNVLDVSEIQPEGHRVASFRQDFFTTNEEFLVLFKNILCLEVLKTRKTDDTDVQRLLLKFLSEPSEIMNLSPLLGTVITYNNGKLEFVSTLITDDQKRQLDKANVPLSAVYEAAELAAKDYLLSLKLKVSTFFGNKDLAVRGKTIEKIESRLNHLTQIIVEKLKQSEPNNIVTIDESMGDGNLQLNGGIGSAVGNILVFDETTKYLKFTDNSESLGKLAKAWYEKLNSEILNLQQYKLDVKVKNFPKLSFERGEYDVSLVRDFYNKLLFFTQQADQHGVEEILRAEIEDHPCKDVNNFRVRSDVIFLKYHDEIQKLWMTPKLGSYLTEKSKIYENAVTNAMSEPLMGVLNIMHGMKNIHYTLNEVAMKRFELLGQIIGTIISSESCVLTVAKVEQYLGNKDHVVLDLEYIFKLPLKNLNTLCKELMNTTKEKVLIIVCNNLRDSSNSCNKLENIAKAVSGKQTIIVTNKTTVNNITKYFSVVSNVLKDERNVFTDLSVESQKQFLSTSKIKLQGEDVTLDLIVDDESVRLIEEDVFIKIMNNETVHIGDTTIYKDNEEQFYVDRRVSRIKTDEHDKSDDIKDKVLETFYDLEEDVVLISAKMGMGKSTLLTHLSRKTKQIDPKVWIVRMNLEEQHDSEFGIHRKWKDKDTSVSILEGLKFLCQAAIGNEYDAQMERKIMRMEVEALIELEESSNGTVSLSKWTGAKSKLFQLNVFLHYYNRGKCIFLFDGFVEDFPRYGKSVLRLINLVRNHPRKHKIWIASESTLTSSTSSSSSFSSSSSPIKIREFGPSYELENFTRLEQEKYLYTLWKFKLQYKNPCNEEIQKIEDAIYIIGIRPFRGYVLFLDFLRMESMAFGLEFPYDEYYNRFMGRLGLSESTISNFADDTTPGDLNHLAECFDKLYKDASGGMFLEWDRITSKSPINYHLYY